MTSNILSEITCPNCGQVNNIATRNLPPGTVLHCSQCTEPVGRWAGMNEGSGFIPEQPVTDAEVDNLSRKADL